MALHSPQENYVGLICTKTNPTKVVLAASEDAAYICNRELGEAPDVAVYGPENFTFSYIPSYLRHMLFELLKNSMRAVVEVHGEYRVPHSMVPPSVKGSRRGRAGAPKNSSDHQRR